MSQLLSGLGAVVRRVSILHRHRLSLLFVALAFLATVSARGDCPTFLSIGSRDADGWLDVTVSTAGNCGGSRVGVLVDGQSAGTFRCDTFSNMTPSCSNTFKVLTSCWGSAPHTLQGTASCGLKNANGSCVAHGGSSGVQSAQFNNRPTVTLDVSEPDPYGIATVTIHAHFQTRATGSQYVRLLRNGEVVAHERLENGQQDFDWTLETNLNCMKGDVLFQAVAMTCGAHWSVIGGNPVPSDPSLIAYSPVVSVNADQKPSASLTIAPPDATGKAIATVTGSFRFRLARRRYVRLFRNNNIYDVVGDIVVEDDQQSVTATIPIYGACTTPTTYRAAAMTCGKSLGSIGGDRVPSDPAFIGYSNEVTPVAEMKPVVKNVTPKKVEAGPEGKRWIEIEIDYDLKGATGKVSLDLKNWTDADGTTRPGSHLVTWNGVTDASSPITHKFLSPSGAQQVTVLATAEACGVATLEASIPCGGCDATMDPVYFADGNVRVTGADPLPPIAGHRLVRTYNSDEQVVAPFGRGWTTLFERRMILNSVGDEQMVSLVTETNEVVGFRGAGGIFRQTWPRAREVDDTLSHDATAGTYTHRPAGSSEVAVFRASDGRLVALRDIATGREAQITYDAQGLPQTIADSWTGVNWILTADAPHRRIGSVAVSGRPDLVWSYSYDSAGNLLNVTAPGGSTWRTYEYVANRMTASYDALGSLIESHTYDADGYGISSTGPGDEIAAMEYNLPGSVSEERVTRITYKTGAIAEYALRPVGGAYRPVRVTGGCSSCGESDATYVHDPEGRVVREQGADGHITVRTYATGSSTRQNFVRPQGCDPRTDSNRCRLAPEALASALLESTAATVLTTYTYGDPLWPDQVTTMETASVLAAGGVRREEYLLDPLTGARLATTVRGWTGNPSVLNTRTTTTTLYGEEPPAFAPGGAFQSAWLSLPQPPWLPRSVNGPRTDVEDVTLFVYYPVDPSVPALLRGQLAAMKNAAGHVTLYEDYDVFGNATLVVDANGVVSERTYDALGRPATSTLKGIPGCDTAADPLCATDLTQTSTYAPAAGPLQMTQGPAGGPTVYAYDSRGRVHTVSRGPSAADLRERIETSYDPLTGKKSLERMLAFEEGSWVEKRRESFTYDAEGHLVTMTHPDGATVHYAYDAAGRIASVRDENHLTPNTLYTYDPAGRLEQVTQTLAGATGGVIRTRYAYDLHGNLTSVTDPNGNETTYKFDDFGQMLEQISPVTGTTTYQYDAAGQLLTTTLVDSIPGDGRDTTNTTTRAYDVLGRVLSSTSVLSAQSEAVSWSYDTGSFGKGRLASMTDPTGTTAYVWDRRGLVLSETKTIGSATYATRFGYDANGSRSRIVYPSGRIVDYGFDYASRPMSAITGETTLVTSASYLPFGPMGEIVFGNGTTRTTTYDPRYRPLTNTLTGLLQEGEDEPTTGVIASYGYTHDAAGNITRIADLVDPAYDRDFGYDDLNRLTAANGGAGLWGAGSYVYDAMGNLRSSAVGTNLRTFTMSATTPKIASVMSDGRVDAVTYDPAGNEIVVGARAYDYSPRNHLRSAGDRRYEYDGRGIRTTTVHTVTLAAFSLDVAIASPSQSVTGTVSLTSVAPAGGASVRLSSSSGAVTVPGEVLVAEGQSSATFTASVHAEAEPGTVTLTATYATSLSAVLTISASAGLSAFTATPSAVIGGNPITAAVTLAEAAPEGGAVVVITAEREQVAGGTITIAAGATSGTTVLDTYPVAFTVTVPLTASYGGSTLEASVEVRSETAAADSLVVVPDGVFGGESASGSITLAAPPPTGGRTFTLTSSNPSMAQVPPSIQIGGDCDDGDWGGGNCPASTFPITTFPVTTATPVTITASDGVVTLEATLTVVCPTGPTPEPTFPAGQTIFIDEALPPGAAMSGALVWDLTQKASGKYSLVAPYAGSGVVHTTITGLSEGISETDKLFVYARVADCAVPRQIVLRAKVGGRWTTANWGAPIWGVTAESIHMGAVPPSGSWQRLDILLRDPAGGGDPVISDLELAHVDGQVWFDRIGRMADCVSATASQPTVPGDEDVLIDDDAPSWIAMENGSNGPLAWTSAQAASGSLSLVHPYRGLGTYVTGFTGLAQPLVAGTKLSLYALVDACSPPVRQIHLRITTSAGSGTVSWGEPVWDIEPSTIDKGPVPASESWARLEVSLAELGLDSGTLTRVDIAHVDGRVWFDRIALWPLTRAQLTSFVSDHESTVSVGATVTWTATATGTVQPLEYRFERRDAVGNWSIVQNYGMQNSYTWTPTAAEVGTNAVRVSVRNGGSLADFEDTATLQVRVVEGGEGGLWLHDSDVRLVWWRRWVTPRVPVSLGVQHGALATTSELPARSHSLYSPELQLLAETEITTSATPIIAYEYIWFAGQPLAQIATATGAIDWYFNDHLGTPILQTDAEAGVTWRVEYDPYGTVFSVRTGEEKRQPLRFPGQENDGAELSYNIFRWYRAGWGRYTQQDPIGVGGAGVYAPSVGPRLFNLADALLDEQRSLFSLSGRVPARLYTFPHLLKEDPQRLDIGTNGYAYVSSNPLSRVDPLGLLNEDNTKPQIGKPYCDFGVCTPKICPPKPCGSMYQCMKKCLGNSAPPWPVDKAWGLLSFIPAVGVANIGYNSGITYFCTVHCASVGCYPDEWLTPW